MKERLKKFTRYDRLKWFINECKQIIEEDRKRMELEAQKAKVERAAKEFKRRQAEVDQI